MKLFSQIMCFTCLCLFTFSSKAQKQKEVNVFELINLKSDSVIIKKYLKGYWVSIEDKRYVIEYDLRNYYEYYSKKQIKHSAYSIAIQHINTDICVNIKFLDNKDLEQMEIIGLTNKVLTLTNNNGNIITFRKLRIAPLVTTAARLQ